MILNARALRRFEPNRRLVLLGLGASLIARPVLAAEEFGIIGDDPGDQTGKVQEALNAASAAGVNLNLPAGMIRVAGLEFPGAILVSGVPGRTVLRSDGADPIGHAAKISDLVLSDIGFLGALAEGLLRATDGASVTLLRCRFEDSGGSGIVVEGAAASIEDCRFARMGDAAIHAMDSLGLVVRGNRIDGCGNAGIRVWRSEPGHDGSIISDNQIRNIDWRGGGNGQNGNGVNLFRADDVIVADNVFTDCAFSAVRANGTRNALIHGNNCLNSGEVGIYSEFDFSGSVIGNNIIDGASTGISITNMNDGGHLATCTGNVVRNIAPVSRTNPGTQTAGIYAEADTVVSGNAIETVPGIGIAVGYGPYVRNVVVSDNVVRDADIGIGVSVVQDAPAGPVRISGNMISSAKMGGIIGLAWEKTLTEDLVRDVGNYPNITLDGNVVSAGS